MGKKYSIGIDFGTLSGRALLVDLETGEEVMGHTFDYPHGVIDNVFPPTGEILPINWALQYPSDYIDTFKNTIPHIINEAKINPKDIIGLGIDFTSCTVMPTDIEGIPLCEKDIYINIPHAYPKLWKHHAAQEEANLINLVANNRNEEFIKRYGGKISSEWLIPKALQILNEAPEIYEDMDKFIEAGDWIVWMLTGKEARSSCQAGYKSLWSKEEGYPSKEFFKSLNADFENITDKLGKDILPIGARAGELNEYGASITGLLKGTSVSVAVIDAHVCAPACGLTKSGEMLMVMGTSTCHIMVSDENKIVPGMCGLVSEGVLPGMYGYEAGQNCVGDHFSWFVSNCTPKNYLVEAYKEGMDIHEYLTKLASKLSPGESGILALDWWNGNRSVLMDADLTGLLIGCTLHTKPEEIYRALIEATAFGSKMIIDTFEEHGVKINTLYACGGIPSKNPFIMQIYADICNREIKISGSKEAGALGAAMFGAIAALSENGGFDSIAEASKIMAKVSKESFKPIGENVLTYNKLYNEYKILHDYFGSENNVMKKLKNIK